jgi:hypothetical protein
MKEARDIGVGWISAMQALHQRLYSGDDGFLLGENDTVEHTFRGPLYLDYSS